MTRVLFLTATLLLGGYAPPAGALDASAEAPQTAVEAWLADPTRIFEASEVSLADFRWIARPIVIFADTPADPRFREQITLLSARAEPLAERDVLIVVDADPAAQSEARLSLRPRGFMLALLGKDGVVKLRKPFPWDVREISRSIDKMPMRQEELRRGISPGG